MKHNSEPDLRDAAYVLAVVASVGLVIVVMLVWRLH